MNKYLTTIISTTERNAQNCSLKGNSIESRVAQIRVKDIKARSRGVSEPHRARKESYGAARYLDLEITRDDNYTVDFNNAYNPYCAYSEDYVCPLPPMENWLPIEIRAGERQYQ